MIPVSCLSIRRAGVKGHLVKLDIRSGNRRKELILLVSEKNNPYLKITDFTVTNTILMIPGETGLQ